MHHNRRYIKNNFIDFIIVTYTTIDSMPLLFMGDQLTVERARKCREARVNSSNAEDALLGLEPSVCDWHAECNFLQVTIPHNDYLLGTLNCIKLKGGA